MQRKPWTQDEIETLRDMRSVKGWSFHSIAVAMGRTPRSVRGKVEREGFPLPCRRSQGVSIGDFPAIERAFNDGVPIRSVAKQMGWTAKAVETAYRVYSKRMKLKGPPIFPAGSYMGAKEMAALAGPICGVSAKAVLSEIRIRQAVLARMAVARALRDRGVSLTVIGNALGGRDHATICNLIERFPYYAKIYPELRMAYQAIKNVQDGARLAA